MGISARLHPSSKNCDMPALVIFMANKIILRAVSQPFSLPHLPLFSERILKAKTHHFDTEGVINATTKEA